MKFILIITLIMFSQASFSNEEMKFVTQEIPIKVKKEEPKPASKLRKDFEASTGIVLGEYTLESNSDEDCQAGKLGIVDYSDELAIMFGSGAFINALGKDKITEKYDECELTYKSSYKGHAIEETREEICKGGGKHLIKTSMNIQKSKVSYIRTVTDNDVLVKEIKCSATLDKVRKVEKVER